MPQGPTGAHRGRDLERSLFSRLRGLSGNLRRRPRPQYGRFRARRPFRQPPRRSRLALYRLHEFQGQAGAKGRRGHRGHRGRALLRRGPQRPLQGAAPAHARRTRGTRHRAGRLLPQRRPAARHGKPPRTPCLPPGHRRAHGGLRCGPDRPQPYARGRRPRPPVLGGPALTAHHRENHALPRLRQPLPAHGQQVLQRAQARLRQPLRARRGQRRSPGQGPQSLPVEGAPPFRVRPPAARSGSARKHRHSPRAQHV